MTPSARRVGHVEPDKHQHRLATAAKLLAVISLCSPKSYGRSTGRSFSVTVTQLGRSFTPMARSIEGATSAVRHPIRRFGGFLFVVFDGRAAHRPSRDLSRTVVSTCASLDDYDLPFFWFGVAVWGLLTVVCVGGIRGFLALKSFIDAHSPR
jgi:hypothetical protein